MSTSSAERALRIDPRVGTVAVCSVCDRFHTIAHIHSGKKYCEDCVPKFLARSSAQPNGEGKTCDVEVSNTLGWPK